ncbi:hypothetical protein [Flavobacterium hiemivividum]|uniref:Uncharacterized protein n=1 Tax=Flavobacterium hiemivividum TaxID=2541734 RepID=A0A4R5D0G8_9FLAO|nr:hypothetical protein [Flavobacterium hiemivividum]TDE06689.1 hypothetical protein E0F98_03480 [Flavobacterium hiemivividum]
MKLSDDTVVRFYRLLGKTFYSIAMVDKTVQKEEIEKLKELVQKEWLPVEDSSDIFGSESAYQIEIVFDWLVENDCEYEQIRPEFKNFKLEHKSLFNPVVNASILKTASAIANSFSGKINRNRFY